MDILTPGAGWALIVAFGLFFFGATWLASRRPARAGERESKEGFLMAGRRLGWVQAAFSIAATWIWAPALFVAAQQGYQHGWVGVFWFTVPNIACLVVFAFFAKRARAMFPEGFTLSSAASARYSSRVQVLYLIALIGLAVASFAVQLLAGAVVVTALTGIPFGAVTLALSVVALSYTAYAGLRGSVVTDWLQMLVIALVGFGLAAAVAVVAGPSTIGAGLAGADGLYTSLTSGPGAAVFWGFGLSTTIGLLSGPFGDQSFWQRAWAVEERDVRRSFILGAGIFAIVPVVMATLGFAAAGGGLLVEDPQLTNLEAILAWLPEWTVVLFLLYVFSGLVSTMSSQLSALSTFAGHDFSRMGDDELRVVRRARLAMIALTCGALAIANIPGIAVVQLFIFYGTLRACTLVPTVLMLSWRRELSERGAFWGIIASLAVALPLSAYGNLTGTTWAIVAGSLAAIGLSGAGVVLGTLLGGRGGSSRGESASPRLYASEAAAERAGAL